MKSIGKGKMERKPSKELVSDIAQTEFQYRLAPFVSDNTKKEHKALITQKKKTQKISKLITLTF